MLFFFWLFSVLNLISEGLDFREGVWFSKPLLMAWLWVYLFIRLPRPLIRSAKYLLAGLIFSMAGDIFLMFTDTPVQGAFFFLAGLGSFLITHLFYLASFSGWPGRGTGLLKQRPWLALFFVVYWLGFVFVFYPHLPGSLRFPVILYSLVIIGMAASAVHLGPRLAPRAFRMLLAGVLLFVFSDTCIAVDKFLAAQFHLPAARLLIMSTYIAGQYLIASGALRGLQRSLASRA